MGHIHVDVVLRGARAARSVRMLADTSATYTIIPPELADEIGLVKLPFRTEVVLTDGQRTSVEAGVAELSVEGRRAPVTVLVMRVEEPLLGSESPEALGLKPNLETGRLEPARRYAVRA